MIAKIVRTSMVALVLVGLSLAAWAQDAEDPVQKTYDMRGCVERGLEANPSIVAARAQLTGAGYDIWAKASDMLPSATASYGYTYRERQPTSGDNDMWGFHAKISQPIFAGFSLLSNLQKSILTEEQAEAQLTQAELSLIGEIQTNFLALLKARMDVKSAQDSVERLKSQLEVTSAFYDVGLRPRLDVLQAEVDLATAEQDLLKAQNSVSTQLAKMNTLLNLPLSQDIEYVGALTELPFSLGFDTCLGRAFQGRPDIDIGEKSVSIARRDVRIAGSELLPSVSADWDYYKFGDGSSLKANENDWSRSAQEYWTASLTASYSLHLGLGEVADTLEANQNFHKIAAQLEETKLNAGYEVKANYLSITEARDRITVARKSVEAATESYRMAQARYQAQVGTNTDVLDAQARLTTAEAGLIQALADYQTALSGLYVSMGEKNPGLDTE